MDTPNWIQQVSTAKDVAPLLAVVNAYVDSRDPRELAALPAECAVHPFSTPEEVALCAYRLAGYHGHDDGSRIIQRARSFFSCAAIRLAELSDRPPPPETA